MFPRKHGRCSKLSVLHGVLRLLQQPTPEVALGCALAIDRDVEAPVEEQLDLVFVKFDLAGEDTFGGGFDGEAVRLCRAHPGLPRLVRSLHERCLRCECRDGGSWLLTRPYEGGGRRGTSPRGANLRGNQRKGAKAQSRKGGAESDLTDCHSQLATRRPQGICFLLASLRPCVFAFLSFASLIPGVNPHYS